jgi:hypothetical protein
MGLPSSLIRTSWSYNAARGTLLRDSFAVIDISASRLPEVRGRACAQAASATYASCRSDSIYILDISHYRYHFYEKFLERVLKSYMLRHHGNANKKGK